MNQIQHGSVIFRTGKFNLHVASATNTRALWSGARIAPNKACGINQNSSGAKNRIKEQLTHRIPPVQAGVFTRRIFPIGISLTQIMLKIVNQLRK
jgi:hypothetical protein